MGQMLAFVGFYHTTEVEINVVDLGNGAGQTTCFECGGTGDWTPYHPEPETGPYQCVQCKGTGRILISI
jgi:DnaJ-class molecular chaperone